MRSTYRVFAYIIAAEVAIQAAMVAYAIFGLGVWVDKNGGVLDKASMESDLDFPGVVGFAVHGMNGMMLIPLIALVFFIISFFAKIPGGVKWAGFVLIAVIVQVALGLFGHENAIFGIFHGLNALLLFSLAVMAGKRVGSVNPEPAAQPAVPDAA
jgi:heme A synthase